MNVDYIVVGLGLAGISFCEQLEQNGKTYVVITDASEQASLVAGGLYNPVILKRITMAWKADLQMKKAMPFYSALEAKLEVTLDHKVPVYRRFASVEEQNNWFLACDKKGFKEFLVPKIIENTNPAIDAPYGMGEVAQTGRVNTKKLISAYISYLSKKGLLKHETFNFEDFHTSGEVMEYQGIRAKNMVFAEGFGLNRNPFFKYLPLNGTKGELLTIRSPQLQEKSVIKSSVFIIPLGNDLYRIGATYKWKDKTSIPTVEAKTELLEKLKTFLKCDFEVVDHAAGIRPTVTDRRPLVGRHPRHNNLFVLNGFGSRGVLIAPYASEQLYDHIENTLEMDSEMDIARFKDKY